MIRKIRSFFQFYFKSLNRKGSFIHSLAVTITGSGLGFLIGFLFTPFIARIYEPNAYGLFALFNAFSANLLVVATFNFPNAFVLPKKESSFHALVQVTFTTLVAICFFSFLVFLFLKNEILQFFNATKLGNWLLLVPAFVFLGGLVQIWNSWNVRAKEFKRGAGAKTASVIFSKGLTLAYGFFTKGAIEGLILGEFLNRPINLVILTSKSIQKDFKRILTTFDWHSIKHVVKHYKNYPLYSMPASWLNLLLDQLPIYFLTKFYFPGIVGQFAFANSLLNIPLQMIGQSIATVFLQKAAETSHEEPQKLSKISIELFNKMLLLGLLPFSLLTVFGDFIFKIFLGSNWEQAGVYAGYLGYYYMFKFLSYPIMSVYRVLRKEKFFLSYTVISIILISFSLLPSLYIENPQIVIKLFSFTSVIVQILNIVFIFRFLRVKNTFKIIAKSAIIIIGTFAFLSFLRIIFESYF